MVRRGLSIALLWRRHPSGRCLVIREAAKKNSLDPSRKPRAFTASVKRTQSKVTHDQSEPSREPRAALRCPRSRFYPRARGSLLTRSCGSRRRRGQSRKQQTPRPSLAIGQYHRMATRFYLNTNRNKRSIAIDLKQPSGNRPAPSGGGGGHRRGKLQRRCHGSAWSRL